MHRELFSSAAEFKTDRTIIVVCDQGHHFAFVAAENNEHMNR